jgi:glycosyltransferase involved in cell wall biosynthesis
VRVLHFSALDGQTGAGVAAARIHEGLIARGIDSRFCVVHPSERLPNSFTPRLTPLARVLRKAQFAVDAWLVRRAPPQFDHILSTGAFGFSIRKIVERERPDIVQLHWIGWNSFRLATLAGIRVPIVWRLADQWAFCGLQHYEPRAQVYSAPPPRSANVLRPLTDISEHVRRRKAITYSRIGELVLVCPSRWLAAETRRSALLGNRQVELIPTSCDTDLFAVKDRNACRTALGLDPQKQIVLTGATSMSMKSKGLDLLIEAVNRIRTETARSSAIQLVTFGQDAFDPQLVQTAIEVKHLGAIRDRRLMSILYSAADVFAAPSRMENLANTVLESLACGTPVVAFAIGGMPDMIEHRVNGYLASPFDTTDFGRGIAWALAQRGRAELQDRCRQKVLDSFSREREIDRYLSLYQTLLSGARLKDCNGSEISPRLCSDCEL